MKSKSRKKTTNCENPAKVVVVSKLRSAKKKKEKRSIIELTNLANFCDVLSKKKKLGWWRTEPTVTDD